MVGHMLGAAGAVGARRRRRDPGRGHPPDDQLHEPDPECDLDYVP